MKFLSRVSVAVVLCCVEMMTFKVEKVNLWEGVRVRFEGKEQRQVNITGKSDSEETQIVLAV